MNTISATTTTTKTGNSIRISSTGHPSLLASGRSLCWLTVGSRMIEFVQGPAHTTKDPFSPPLPSTPGLVQCTIVRKLQKCGIVSGGSGLVITRKQGLRAITLGPRLRRRQRLCVIGPVRQSYGATHSTHQRGSWDLEPDRCKRGCDYHNDFGADYDLLLIFLCTD